MMKTIKTKTAKTAFAGFGTACALALAGVLFVAPAPARAAPIDLEVFRFVPDDCPEEFFEAENCYAHAGGEGSFGDQVPTPQLAGFTQEGAVYALDVMGETVRLRFTAFRPDLGLLTTLGSNAAIRGVGAQNTYIGAEEAVWLEILGLEDLAEKMGNPLVGRFELTAVELFVPTAGFTAQFAINAYQASAPGNRQLVQSYQSSATIETTIDSTNQPPVEFNVAGAGLRGNVFEFRAMAITTPPGVTVEGYSLAGLKFTYLPGEIPLPPAVWALGASLALFGAVGASRRRRAKG